MEVAGNGVGPFHLGPLTSTPIESSTPSLATRADSLSSENSESSEEDWLIKVCCPGARHRYSKRAHAKKDYTRVPRQESTDLEWLIRLRCPRAQMEQLMPDLKQALVNESQDVIGPIQLLLERESCFIREVDRYLKHNDFLALRRREMLYKKWFESVSRPLLQKIQDKVDNQSSKEIEERKRKQLSLYLNYCNEKLSPTELVSSPDALPSLPKYVVPPVSSPVLQSSSPSATDTSLASQNPPESESKYGHDFSAYHSHNPFFLPVLPPIQSQRSVAEMTGRKDGEEMTSVKDGLGLEILKEEVENTSQASVPPLRDPLLKEVEGRYIEASIMQQCETGKLYSSKDVHELHKTELPPLPLGRQLMNPIDWLKIPFQYMESDVRQKSRSTIINSNKVWFYVSLKSKGDIRKLATFLSVKQHQLAQHTTGSTEVNTGAE
ncbi:hypothetical protein Chor_015662 [Crotalus horridus]